LPLLGPCTCQPSSSKVRYAEDKYAHLRVFQNLSGDLTLHGYELNHTRTDPITYF
uniref:Uncharacterized protein n=1 Tax=Podarcis muralis TaxID=64176 RepID=A0A670IC15_PODMU